MKAIAINGSPRKRGNTEMLLKKVLTPLTAAGRETDFVQLAKAHPQLPSLLRVLQKKNARCSQKDDFFNPCFEKMAEADAIILGLPAYFTDVSAEMKARWIAPGWWRWQTADSSGEKSGLRLSLSDAVGARMPLTL